MPKRSLLAAVLAAATAVLALVAVQPTVSAQAAPVRIMPLGDSITGSPGCWRAMLWNRLQSNGYTNVDFVGTLPPQGCGVAHDGDNEGHGGILATNMAAQNQLPPWLSATNPDVVLMHLGTNDTWSNRPTQAILDAFTTLVNQMRANNPDMRVIVAQIIPLEPPTCGECAARAVALNNAIPAWAAGLSTTRSPIVVVDQWTGFATATDTYDGVHPNAAGDQKMADRWYPALTRVLAGAIPTAPPTTIPPTTAPTTVPPTTAPTTVPPTTPPGGDRGCTATYETVGQWPGGFQGAIVVRNPGPTAISGWTVTWTWADGQRVSQAWNATVTQSGAGVTARNVSWNGALGAGATATAGFIASWTGSNTAPILSCAAG